MESLKVLHNSVDYTRDAFDFTRDSFSINYEIGEYVYIGYRKPFRDIYIDILTVGTSINGLFEYWNGLIWATLDVLDDTRSLTRSGFVNYVNPDDWALATVSTVEQFYIRYSQDVTETLGFNGINTILCADNDLDEKYRKISRYLKSGETSFIKTHQTVRKDVIQKIRNKGGLSVAGVNDVKDITEWDLLDRSQLKNASVYYALENIFDGVSDSVEDKYDELAKKFKKKGDDAFRTFLLAIDKDDDGIADTGEMVTGAVSTIIMRRI